MTKSHDDTARGFVGVPHAKTETSKEAAESMVTKVGTQRYRVWEFVHEQGAHGATSQEIEEGLSLSGNAVRPRLVELRAAGKVIKVNNTRETASGRRARVHVAVDGGL
jgi:predicted ArsR family transcriptional regulator